MLRSLPSGRKLFGCWSNLADRIFANPDHSTASRISEIPSERNTTVPAEDCSFSIAALASTRRNAESDLWWLPELPEYTHGSAHQTCGPWPCPVLNDHCKVLGRSLNAPFNMDARRPRFHAGPPVSLRMTLCGATNAGSRSSSQQCPPAKQGLRGSLPCSVAAGRGAAASSHEARRLALYTRRHPSAIVCEKASGGDIPTAILCRNIL